MSSCCREKDEATLRSEQIDKELRADGKVFRNEVKMLLLGPGDSGKSTLAKQIKIIHMSGFRDAERQSYRAIIYSNLIFAFKQVILAAQRFELVLQKANKKAARRLIDNFFIFPEDEPLGADISADLAAVWSDKAVVATFARRAEFDLIDSAAYFLAHIDRIGRDDYVPSDLDILHSRQRTRGIIETVYSVQQTDFRIVDVGGQRNERAKWVHCFEGVTAIIFCASLSEYNQALEENPDVNRMRESLALWEGICRYVYFEKTAFILFLNKVDLFEQKLAHHPLTVAFPEYVAPAASDAAARLEHAKQFVRAAYLARKVLDTREVTAHFTCATDTQKINVVFDAIYEHLLNRHLQAAYML
jgi:GTPase SAR1 family protein